MSMAAWLYTHMWKIDDQNIAYVFASTDTHIVYLSMNIQ